MPKNKYRTKISPELEPVVRTILEKEGFMIRPVSHAIWQANRERMFVTLYPNGGIFVRGKNADHFGEELISQINVISVGQEIQGEVEGDWAVVNHFGENYFWGPLVTSAILNDERSEKRLARIGLHKYDVTNMKELFELAKVIKHNSTHSISTMTPLQYNRFSNDYSNPNQILAVANANVIKNIVSKEGCTKFSVSGYGDDVLLRELLSEITSFSLVHRMRNENNSLITSVHILAKARYYEFLADLEKKYETVFPERVSKMDADFVDSFVAKFGKKALRCSAKLGLAAHH